jgi:dUTP pyrophosphatase
MKIPVRRLPHAEELPLPAYATEGSAGLDLLAAVAADTDIPPGGRALIPTGIVIALPPGYEAQVRPRSGLALKFGVTLLNAPGTVDSDYRGEIKAIVINLGSEPFRVSRGMKIAQLVINRFERIDWNETDLLPESGRGSGGFGSTGTHI